MKIELYWSVFKAFAFKLGRLFLENFAKCKLRIYFLKYFLDSKMHYLNYSKK